LESKVKRVIPSSPAAQLYAKLKEAFTEVFPELNPVSMIDFEAVKDHLSGEEQGWCFQTRIDFVCCNGDGNPAVIIEYDGKHHEYDGPKEEARRQFKQKLCELVNIPFLVIKSPAEITQVYHLFKNNRGVKEQ
jgi:hypothetical protein